MFERDEHISFANCGLPYYLGGIIQNRDDLFVQTPEKMKAEFNIEVRIFSEVTAVNPAGKSVTVNSRGRGIYQESYDYLILTPGAKPLKPPIPGIEHKNILTMRNVADTDAIHNCLSGGQVRRVAVIGGGFIGVEMAENLRHQGLAVTLVEAVPHILAPFDTDMAVILERELEEHGVRLLLGDAVKAFHRRDDGGVDVELSSGRQVESDLVILAIGVAPDTAFLKGSGLELGPKGHIVVDGHMRSSDPCIYAAGDATEIVDFADGRKTAVPLAGPANLQGRIAADNISGRDSVYQGAIGSSVIKVFNLTAAATGSNERQQKQLGRGCRVAVAHPQSHASYYPGAAPMTLKLIYDEQGRVLGAQGIGGEGVDKSIDVIAAVIKLKGRVSDLAQLELCYAPPFSSAKAPVNMVAYVAENTLDGLFSPITYTEYQDLDRAELTLLDVRFKAAYDHSHLDGAISIPLEELRSRLPELDREKLVVAYCTIGRRSYEAARILAHHGFQARSLVGGYTTASAQNFKPHP
jgi:NADPH-dependent 2,4-dienoyl-CoA reductase/sulfur reductase-like enzyme/rhodanese-related sulfurtransferase